MIKQVLKIIWNQRRNNGWIFGELLIVTGILLLVLDGLWVDYRVSNQPLGFNPENTYILNLALLNEKAADYLPEEERTTTDAEDLLTLMGRIRQFPEVEEVCATINSNPFGWAQMYTIILPEHLEEGEADKRNHNKYYMVTPEFFRVYQIKDMDGNLIDLPSHQDGFVFTKEMEEEYFKGVKEKNVRLKIGEGADSNPLLAVSQSIRENDYGKAQPFFYQVMGNGYLNEMLGYRDPSGFDLGIRMRQKMNPEEMNDFLLRTGDLLRVNNVYVYGYDSQEDRRENRIRSQKTDNQIYLTLVIFLLINVWFGIMGIFWMRTQKRRSEIGLRVASGSSKWNLLRYLNLEGLLLLAFTIPFIAIYIFNLYYFDVYATWRIPLSATRFLIIIGGTYLIMGIMICLGVFFPGQQATQIPASEALREE